MKSFIILIALGLVSQINIAQTQQENHIKTSTYLEASQNGEGQTIEQVSYYDGLGRMKQTVNPQAGGNSQDIRMHYGYDALGRTPKSYLPYASQQSGDGTTDIVLPEQARQATFDFYNTSKYEHTINPYSQTRYEASPLGRTYEQAAPGNSWLLNDSLNTDHTIKYDYATNNTTDQVLQFIVSFAGGNTTSPTLTLQGHYLPEQLSKRIIKDENWTPQKGVHHTTEEYLDKLGRTILKRTFVDNEQLDTYYIYDDFNNLSFVLSPEASTQIVTGNLLVSNAQQIIDQLGYQYIYDYRNRLIEKKVPAKAWEYIVYNLLDQPLLSQDANLRENDQWLVTKYDAWGRVAYTSIATISATLSRDDLQNLANNTTDYPTVYEHRLSSPIQVAGTSIYYSNQSFPTETLSEIHTVNYYDNYVDTDGINIPATNHYGTTLKTNLKSLPTVSKVRVLKAFTTNGQIPWITTVTAYDEKARAVYIHSKNDFLDTEDTVESLLNFTGNPVESRSLHTRSGHYDITTTDYFTYDHQNRLVSHKQQLNEEPLQLIAHNFYDELNNL